MRTALIVGGTGQIGLAIANRLTGLGWSVTITSRTETPVTPEIQHKIVDASNSDNVNKAMLGPIDLLVSCIAFDEMDAATLLGLHQHIGRIVAISSASVYCDKVGRTLDEARENGFPVFDGPMSERTQTVAPGPETYSTRKMSMEKMLTSQNSIPVTILRPCAVHGPNSSHAREWWFVKRLLDGRKRIPLAYGGKSQFQTTSVYAIADAVVLAADNKLPVVTNVCDADSPTVMEIGQSIIDILDIDAELVGLADNTYPPIAGATPWSSPEPFTLSSVAPSKQTYAETVRPCVEWLTAEVNNDNWKKLLPNLAGYPGDHFDYSIDDTVV